MAGTSEKPPAGSTWSARTEEEALLKRFRQGDESVFDDIVSANSNEVAALALRLMGWSEDIEDIVQDVFFAAYKGLKRFRAESNIKTWLFRITINQCRKRQRRRFLWKRFVSSFQSNHRLTYGQNGSKNNMNYQLAEKTRLAVRKLPGKYREPMVLKYLQDIPIKEIAGILNLSTNAVEVRLNRARQKIRQMLAEDIKRQV
jgi:RNA polymerase sigma-70 factor (ECF subfamily)